MTPVHFDIYLVLFLFLAYPLIAAAWRMLAGLFFSSSSLSTVGQGIAGVT